MRCSLQSMCFCAVACPDHQFRCETTGLCIPKFWSCDGFQNCLDGSDEVNCGKWYFTLNNYTAEFALKQHLICGAKLAYVHYIYSFSFFIRQYSKEECKKCELMLIRRATASFNFVRIEISGNFGENSLSMCRSLKSRIIHQKTMFLGCRSSTFIPLASSSAVLVMTCTVAYLGFQKGGHGKIQQSTVFF